MHDQIMNIGRLIYNIGDIVGLEKENPKKP
jgi:hypothetical protein